MPITVNGPGGVNINFPDGTDAATINGVMQQHFGQAAPAAKPSFMDQIKSIPGGMVQGFATAAANQGQGEAAQMGMEGVPGGEESAKLLEQNVTGQLPSNGTYGRSVGEALGNPANYIGGKIIPAIAMGIGSGLGSQAGQDIGGTPGRIIGGIAGALGGNKVGGVANAAEKAATAAVPTSAELKAASQAAYKSPDVAAVQIKPEAVTNLAAQIENDLLKQGFRPSAKSAADTFGEVRNLRVPSGVESVGIADLDSARKALGVYAKEVDAVGKPTAEATAAPSAIRHIDEFLPNLKQTDLLAGDAAQASSTLQEARGNWAGYKQSQLAETKMENARIQAASTYGGGNINNALRQAYRPLEVNNYGKVANWSPEAKDALANVVEGQPIRNALRDFGRIAPTGPVNIGLHATAALGSGGMTLPIAAAAYLAKKAGEAGTKNAANQLSELLRSQTPLYAQRAGQAGVANALNPTLATQGSQLTPALLRALLLSGATLPR